MRIAIIDDLTEDLEYLNNFVCRWAEENQIPLAPPPGLYKSAEDFLGTFSANMYDIVFLDIYMDGMTGMEAANYIRRLDNACRLIFTTTTSEYAVESYDVNASYYLVKPYSYEKFKDALNRCEADYLEEFQCIQIPLQSGANRLLLHQITYTEYENRRIYIHFKDGSTDTVAMNQRMFAGLLLEYPYFCDCMKGILVNFEAVDKLLKDGFLLKSGVYIPISRLKYREVKEQFLSHIYDHTKGAVTLK